MKFNATDEQVAQIVANAYNASVPMGMGYLHYTPEDLPAEAFLHMVEKKAEVYLDYCKGRMMKFRLERTGQVQEWDTGYGEPNVKYESWARKYRTWDDLVGSVIK